MARSTLHPAVPAEPTGQGTVKEPKLETERKEHGSRIEGPVGNGAETPMLSGDAKMEESQVLIPEDKGPGKLYLRFRQYVGNRKKPKFSKNLIIVVLLISLLISLFWNVYLAGFKECPGLPSAPGPSDATSCPEAWKQNGSQCYFFADTEGTWNDSQRNCSSFGGSLVTMDSPLELEYVMRSKLREYTWIGLHREGVGHPWKLPNGSLFNADSLPPNLRFTIKGEGFCAYLNEKTFRSTWCSNKNNWICKKPIRAVGEKH